MMRIIAGAFAALLLLASPVWAQSLGDQINTAASDNPGTDLPAAVDPEGFTADMQALIVAQYNAANPDSQVTSIEAINDTDLASTVGAMLANNNDLSAAQATAVVRAAIRSRPNLAVQIASAAAYARRDIAKQIQIAAVSVAPANLTQQIVTATVIAAVAGVADGQATETNVSEG